MDPSCKISVTVNQSQESSAISTTELSLDWLKSKELICWILDLKLLLGSKSHPPEVGGSFCVGGLSNQLVHTLKVVGHSQTIVDVRHFEFG